MFSVNLLHETVALVMKYKHGGNWTYSAVVFCGDNTVCVCFRPPGTFNLIVKRQLLE